MRKFIQKHGVFILIFIGYSLAYLFYLGHRPLSVPDEGRYPEVAREMLQFGHWITPKVNGVPFLDKPPLYYWIEALSMSIMGVTRLAIRLPIACFALLGLVVTYWTSFQLYNRKTALLATLFLGSSLLYGGAAHYANLDLEVAIWINLSLGCFIISQQDGQAHRIGYLVSAYLAAAFGFLTKGMIAIVFPIMITGLWVMIGNHWHRIRKMMIIPGLFIILLVIMPWLLAVAHQNPHFWRYFFYFQQVNRFLSPNFNNNMPFWFYLPILIIAMSPALLICLGVTPQALKRHGFKSLSPNTLFWLVAAIVIFVFFSIPKAKIVGYILPTLMPLAILMARLLEKNYLSLSLKWGQLIQFFLAGLFAVAAIAIWAKWSKLHQIALQHHIPILSFKLIAILMILSCLGTLICLKLKKPLALIALCGIWGPALLMTASYSTQNLQIRSSLKLAQFLKPKLSSNTIIVDNNNYHFDLPIYLQKRLYVTYPWNNPELTRHDNWVGDFTHGFNKERFRYPWMILPRQLKNLWKTHPQVVLITSPEDGKTPDSNIKP